MHELLLTGENLKIEDVVRVARPPYLKVNLAQNARNRIKESHKRLKNLLKSKDPIYGLNTGVGSLLTARIPQDKLEDLQKNLVLSHAAGVGEYLPEEVVRAAVLLRINTFAKGYSGVREEVIDLLIELLNKRITPLVPSYGSVGASGDLAPLAHIANVIADTGVDSYVLYNGKKESGDEVFRKLGLKRIKLAPKEGLALTNGTQISTSIATLSIYDANKLLNNAINVAALTLQALCANPTPCCEELQRVRPHKGQSKIAKKLSELLKNSKLVSSSLVQDAYSLRCIPVVYGSVLDTIEFVRQVVEIECNSATDNPLIFEEKAYSGCNFHGQPIAFCMDYLGIAITTLGVMSERRIARLLDRHLNKGLPPFLASDPGIESGLMLLQYTAASLVAENRILCSPASVQSIPTCENQEDFVSMSHEAGLKLRKILENTNYIFAIEAICAMQAVRLRQGEDKLSPQTYEFYKNLQNKVALIEKDRPLSEDVEKIKNLFQELE